LNASNLSVCEKPDVNPFLITTHAEKGPPYGGPFIDSFINEFVALTILWLEAK
jgi:hypothetical protein